MLRKLNCSFLIFILVFCMFSVTSFANSPIQLNSGVYVTKYNNGFNLTINRNEIPQELGGFTKISICGTDGVSESIIQNIIDSTQTHQYGVMPYDDINGVNSGNSLKDFYNIVMLLNDDNIVIGYYIIPKEVDDIVTEPSTAPAVSDITIINSEGDYDVIGVRNLNEGDRVKVYRTPTDKYELTDLGTVGSGQNKIDGRVCLPDTTGFVYVTVTSSGKAESEKVEVAYTAPSGQSAKPVQENLFWDNFNIPGYVGCVVTVNINGGDLVKVYDQPEGGNLLGWGQLPLYQETGGECVMLQALPADNIVYVSLLEKGKFESERVRLEVNP